jgi:ankyrin repeat protein
MGNRQGQDVQRKQLLIQSLHSDGKLVTAQDSEFRFGELSWSLLHYACWCSNADLVERLVDLNFDLNAQDIHGNTPLHLAKLQNHGLIYSLLVRNGASTSTANYQGKTPASLDSLFSTPETKEPHSSLNVTTDTQEQFSFYHKNMQHDPVPCPDSEDSERELISS